jgi:hypothetical protein
MRYFDTDVLLKLYNLRQSRMAAAAGLTVIS